MTADALLLPLLALAAGLLWLVALRHLGLLADPAVLAWRRLARLRGLSHRPSLGERLGRRLPMLQRLQAETDVGRLLKVAGRADTPAGWLLRTAGLAAAVMTVFFLADQLTLATEHRPGAPPALGLLGAGAGAGLAYSRLRSAAAARRRRLALAVADALPHLAVMTYHHRLPVSEALLIFARCQRDRSLHDLLHDGGLSHPLGTELLERQPSGLPATATLYEQAGRTLGVPTLSALGAALRLINERGLSSQEVLTRLARDMLAERAAEARVAAAQTRTLIVVPVGLMIIPVLLLVAAPVAASLGRLFAR